MPVCPLCPHHCRLEDGGPRGMCRVRFYQDGAFHCGNYGILTSTALDPIEKKPLARFYPGRTILSLGSYGCNLRCPFCQNFTISQAGPGAFRTIVTPPEAVARESLRLRDYGNLGVAFTYNEPLLSWEYIRDTGTLVHAQGQYNVVVTNGCFDAALARELAPVVDAYNIDLKGFTPEWYVRLGGDLATVQAFIAEAVRSAHVELTTLIVPGENDGDEEMDSLAAWVASLSPDIPLHVSKFFPRWNLVDRKETPTAKVYHLAEIARRHLHYVYTGNC